MSNRKAGPAGYLAYLVLSGMAWFVRIAPPFMKQWGFKAVILLAYHGWRARTTLAKKHCAAAFPERPPDERERVVYGAYMNLAAFCTEFCLMPRMNADNLDSYVRFTGLEEFDTAFHRGKGVILVWAHFDNFEWVNNALALKGYPVYSLIREVDNVWLDRALDGIRTVSGQKIIKREDSALEIVKRLREGAVVTIATDQNAMYNSVYVRFFGMWAATIKSPAVLHMRTGAAIIPVYSVRETDNSHTAHLLPEIIMPLSGDRKRDVVLITQAIAAVQEQFIKARPELWLWLHRRWKIQPDEKEKEYYSSLLDAADPRRSGPG